MIQVLQEIFQKTLARLAQHLITYIPPLVVAATVIAAAFVLAAFLRWLILRVVKAPALDKFLRESGVSTILERSGRLRGAAVLATVCYWTVLVVGLLTALDVFDTTLTSRIVEVSVFSIPKLVTAGAILLAGFWLGHYLRRSTLIWAVNEEIPWARRLASAVRVVVIFVTVVVAADALNFASQVFFAAFVILVGGAALAASIAAGLSFRGALGKYWRAPSNEPVVHAERSLWNHL